MNEIVMIAAGAGIVAELTVWEMQRRARRRREHLRRIPWKAMDHLNEQRRWDR